ncbi:hypothetical protein LguiB_034503 [Lonicera macranthoides]
MVQTRRTVKGPQASRSQQQGSDAILLVPPRDGNKTYPSGFLTGHDPDRASLRRAFLSSGQGGEYKERAKILKEEVIKIMLKEGRDVVSQLEIIDVVQRLGISYHFEDEIDGMLKSIYVNYNNKMNFIIEHDDHKEKKERNQLYVAALQFRLLREHGFFVLPQDYCKSILVEAKWYHKGYKPTLSEYLESAWLSVGGPFLMVAAYFAIANPITKEAMESIELYPSIVRWSCMIIRLTDDLATSSDELKRGDVPKSIQCYMHDTGVCEKEAREHIKHLISETWKKVNNNLFTESPFPKTYIRASMNLARTSQCMYQFSDGHGAPTHEAKERQYLRQHDSLALDSPFRRSQNIIKRWSATSAMQNEQGGHLIFLHLACGAGTRD